MKKRIFIAFLSVIIFITQVKIAHAFDDEDTHPKITEKSIYNSNLNAYLKQTLGLSRGIETILPTDGKDSSMEWLKKGSKLEDSPDCRAANHFYDPISNSGLTDMNASGLGTFLEGVCRLESFLPGITWYHYPALNWATEPESSTGNDMSWDAAIKYYKDALISEKKDDREANFAKTFQAIGQVLHFI